MQGRKMESLKKRILTLNGLRIFFRLFSFYVLIKLNKVQLLWQHKEPEFRSQWKFAITITIYKISPFFCAVTGCALFFFLGFLSFLNWLFNLHKFQISFCLRFFYTYIKNVYRSIMQIYLKRGFLIRDTGFYFFFSVFHFRFVVVLIVIFFLNILSFVVAMVVHFFSFSLVENEKKKKILTFLFIFSK